MNRAALEQLRSEGDGWDCLGSFTDRGMHKLLTHLGCETPPDTDWSERVAAAADAGRTRLKSYLDADDPEVRATVTQVLEWCWDDAVAGLALLRRLLTGESNQVVRVGAFLAVARLASSLPIGHQLRAETDAWLTAVATSGPLLDRFAAGLGVLLYSGRTLSAAAVDSMAVALPVAYQPYFDLTAELPQQIVDECLSDQPASRLRFQLGLAANTWRPPTFLETAGLVARTSIEHGLDAAQIEQLMAAIASAIVDPHADADTRLRAVRALGAFPLGSVRPVADQVATAVTAADRPLREAAMTALARTGDVRALPALLDVIRAGSRTEGSGFDHTAIGAMRPHAAAILPDVVRRFAAVQPVQVTRYDDGSYSTRGGLDGLDWLLLDGLALWRGAAASVVPQLQRLLAMYEAYDGPRDHWQTRSTTLLRSALVAIEERGHR
ncbi:HEAT repeat domain-containing protein [Kribbella sandramycini]|uniref:HEAT repeat domain-containing protein n=1 Tax=Kribbella sandramycini TaxID=60450 RepID=A0A7Y4KU40_9ACTN|nr:HEAT repeat domain-containing protein [Kribbella sandramycini]MBB6568669.1 hypothetical protein [Kribbella sandramycini]NOL38745.1 HEAT repeat domain-containing protein [Kribbella sandramycini]